MTEEERLDEIVRAFTLLDTQKLFGFYRWTEDHLGQIEITGQSSYELFVKTDGLNSPWKFKSSMFTFREYEDSDLISLLKKFADYLEIKNEDFEYQLKTCIEWAKNNIRLKICGLGDGTFDGCCKAFLQCYTWRTYREVLYDGRIFNTSEPQLFMQYLTAYERMLVLKRATNCKMDIIRKLKKKNALKALPFRNRKIRALDAALYRALVNEWVNEEEMVTIQEFINSFPRNLIPEVEFYKHQWDRMHPHQPFNMNNTEAGLKPPARMPFAVMNTGNAKFHI